VFCAFDSELDDKLNAGATTVHCAVSVTLLATVPEDGYVAAAAYVVEPSLQPANV
jgi:hypothetical protein